jgi:hypothetical protein
MRGEERWQRMMLMVMEPGDRVPKEHPLRRVKETGRRWTRATLAAVR